MQIVSTLIFLFFHGNEILMLKMLMSPVNIREFCHLIKFNSMLISMAVWWVNADIMLHKGDK